MHTKEDGKRLTKKQLAENEQEARATLREHIKPGATIYTSLQHVSSDGMSRRIRVYVVRDGRIWDITWWTANACGFRYNTKHEALVVGGAGMDMGYHVAYSLASALYRGHFTCIGEGCPSNDHVNGDPKGYEVGHEHTDGGYSLRHSWL